MITKLFIPPTRPEFVSRPELTERLNIGLERKLTLISAPAGFGKTTLISEWVHSLKLDSSEDDLVDYKIAWISLDKDDNDPVRFLTYFISALKAAAGIRKDLAESLLDMLQSPQMPPVVDIVTAIINEGARLKGRMIIIIDDYHLIEASLVNKALSLLIENLPPQLHLAILTRDDPHLPLARFRAKGQMIELRAAELRFTPDEITAFLHKQLGIQLSLNDITRIDAYTEGWITGLRLVAVSLQGQEDALRAIQNISGSHRFVLDYLLEEVLNQQNVDIQKFLIQTALLDRMTGSLCDAVTGQDNGQVTLDNLDSANLFITPLDNERKWYRYHHLFADLLHQRLKQTQSELLPILHSKASKWYEQQGFITEAINHSLSGADYNRAAKLIGTHLEDKYEQVATSTLQRWFAAMPAELIETQPRLILLQAWSQFNSGQLEAAVQSLQSVTQILDTEAQRSNPERDMLSGRTAAIFAFITSINGDLSGTIQHAKRALDILPDAEHSWRSVAAIALGDVYAAQGQMAEAQQIRAKALALSQSSGDPYVLMIANLNMAETLWLQGQLPSVIEICERLMQMVANHNMIEAPIASWLLGLWGGSLAELNQLDKALELTKNGVELAEHSQDMTYISSSNLHRVRALFSAGYLQDAQAILQRMAHTYTLPLWAATQISAWQIRLWMAQGKISAATQWLAERNLSLDGKLPFVHEPEYIAIARILLAEGRLDEVVELLQHLFEAAETGGRISKVIEILVLQSLAFQAGDDMAQAVTLLEKALRFAKPYGFIRTFVDEGPSMARLLYGFLEHELHSDYVQQLLAAFPDLESEQTSSLRPQTAEANLIETLSERELEVLHLITAGLSRQEIAEDLTISANTVKTHTRNIYSKLGVKNQMQAAGKARALGLSEND